MKSKPIVRERNCFVRLGSILSGYQIAAMTIVGGLMLLCIALRLLKIKEVAVANLLPALAIAPIFALVVHQFV